MTTSTIRVALFTALAAVSAFSSAAEDIESAVARGQYLAKVAGCNDCHTRNYPETAGNVPLDQWLTGTDVGFQGPWGVSYPANLRLYFADLSEQQWLTRARMPMLPPMPWFALRDMSDEDLLAIYHFAQSLGPAGEPVPMAVAPHQPVATPYIEFVPKNLPTQAAQH